MANRIGLEMGPAGCAQIGVMGRQLQGHRKTRGDQDQGGDQPSEWTGNMMTHEGNLPQVGGPANNGPGSPTGGEPDQAPIAFRYSA